MKVMKIMIVAYNWDFCKMVIMIIEITMRKMIMDFYRSDWSMGYGVVGGQPCWLNPSKPLTYRDIVCNVCEEPMIHLLHLYCPLDDPEHAFHRTLYVYCCKKSSCVVKGSVKCFRYQLSRSNPYFPYESKDGKIIDENMHLDTDARAAHPYYGRIPKLCAVCGVGR